MALFSTCGSTKEAIGDTRTLDKVLIVTWLEPSSSGFSIVDNVQIRDWVLSEGYHIFYNAKLRI